jgi:hypothetical protein
MSCNQIVCDKGIYNKSSHKKALLAIKKEKGYGFEQNPEYKELANCLSEVEKYRTKIQCGNKENSPDLVNLREHFDEFMKHEKKRDELLKKVDPKLYKRKISVDKLLEKYNGNGYEEKSKYSFDTDYKKKIKDLKQTLVTKKKEDKIDYYNREQEIKSSEYHHSKKRRETYLEELKKLDDEYNAIKVNIKEVLKKFANKNGGTRKYTTNRNRTRRHNKLLI